MHHFWVLYSISWHVGCFFNSKQCLLSIVFYSHYGALFNWKKSPLSFFITLLNGTKPTLLAKLEPNFILATHHLALSPHCLPDSTTTITTTPNPNCFEQEVFDFLFFSFTFLPFWKFITSRVFLTPESSSPSHESLPTSKLWNIDSAYIKVWGETEAASFEKGWKRNCCSCTIPACAWTTIPFLTFFKWGL